MRPLLRCATYIGIQMLPTSATLLLIRKKSTSWETIPDRGRTDQPFEHRLLCVMELCAFFSALCLELRTQQETMLLQYAAVVLRKQLKQ
jgi:hypothetical protein